MEVIRLSKSLSDGTVRWIAYTVSIGASYMSSPLEVEKVIDLPYEKTN
jgi:hypothetical protein